MLALSFARNLRRYSAFPSGGAMPVCKFAVVERQKIDSLATAMKDTQTQISHLEKKHLYTNLAMGGAIIISLLSLTAGIISLNSSIRVEMKQMEKE